MRFACQSGCTKCCEQRGFVYLGKGDVARLAAHFEISEAEFEKRYVYRTKNLARFRTPRKSPCPFLKADGCSVHIVKPTQCRAFPFWPEMLDDQKEWQKTAQWCPGIGKGDLIQIGVAREQADEMRVAYPHMYR